MPLRDFAGILHSRPVSAKENVDEDILGAETCQQSKIDIPRHARLAPSLNGDPPDEAGAPALPVTEILKLAGSLKEGDHRRSFANHSCISTIPDNTRAGSARVT